MRHTTDTLRRETQSLSTALRRPQVRGRWGEMHLRRAVELAGLVDRCDFTEQAALDDGALRPDLVVRLAGDKCVVVDAKVPLDAFLDATGTDDEDAPAAHLARHAAAAPPARRRRSPPSATGGPCRSRRSSWSSSCPGEAVPVRRARGRPRPARVRRRSARSSWPRPTTLIALLRTVAHGWSHEALADQAREIHRLGRELHERLATDERSSRPGRPLAQRHRRALQPGGRLPREPGPGQRPAVRRDGRHRRRAAGAAPGRDHRPVTGHGSVDAAPSCTPPTRPRRRPSTCSATSSPDDDGLSGSARRTRGA